MLVFCQLTKKCFTFFFFFFFFLFKLYIFSCSYYRFFRQYLLLLVLNQMASALFRFIGAIGRGDLILANSFGSFALVTLFALGGFVLSRGII